MTDRKRLWVLLLMGLAILAMVLLSAGLSNLTLLPGRPLAHQIRVREVLRPFVGPTSGAEIFGFIFRVLYILALVLVPVAIIYFVVSPEARRRALRSLGLLLWLLALYLVMRNRPDILDQFQIMAPAEVAVVDIEMTTVEFAANIPPWLVPVMTIGLALLTATGLVGTAWFVWQRGRRPQNPLEQLAQEAQAAVEAIRAGADVKNTVMRCYFEMNQVLAERRGLQRDETMTPREFEMRLKEAGLPDEYIGQLTRIFEAVRYGARVASEQEEQQALTCLTAIADTCRSSS